MYNYSRFKNYDYKDLNLFHTSQIRLWIYSDQEISYHKTILSPKLLITEFEMHSTISKILSPYKNKFNTVKLFVECSRDQAFYETKQNKIQRFIQSNASFSNLPQINNLNNVLIFIKYFKIKIYFLLIFLLILHHLYIYYFHLYLQLQDIM